MGDQFLFLSLRLFYSTFYFPSLPTTSLHLHFIARLFIPHHILPLSYTSQHHLQHRDRQPRDPVLMENRPIPVKIKSTERIGVLKKAHPKSTTMTTARTRTTCLFFFKKHKEKLEVTKVSAVFGDSPDEETIHIIVERRPQGNANMSRFHSHLAHPRSFHFINPPSHGHYSFR